MCGQDLRAVVLIVEARHARGTRRACDPTILANRHTVDVHGLPGSLAVSRGDSALRRAWN